MICCDLISPEGYCFLLEWTISLIMVAMIAGLIVKNSMGDKEKVGAKKRLREKK